MAVTVHPRCGARWSGTRACHCAGCCRTFSSTSAFDHHQRGGGCRDPQDVGLVEVVKAVGTVWAWPGSDPTFTVEEVEDL